MITNITLNNIFFNKLLFTSLRLIPSYLLYMLFILQKLCYFSFVCTYIIMVNSFFLNINRIVRLRLKLITCCSQTVPFHNKREFIKKLAHLQSMQRFESFICHIKCCCWNSNNDLLKVIGMLLKSVIEF